MKIYVAAKFEEGPLARQTMTKLEELGHKITHDWTGESSEGKTARELALYQSKCAFLDLQGVRLADLVFLINHPNGKGMFTELGAALALRIPIIVVDRSKASNIFLHLDEVGESTIYEVKDVEEGLRLVDSLTKSRKHLAPYITHR